MHRLIQRSVKPILLIIVFSITGLYGCIAPSGAGTTSNNNNVSDADLVAQIKQQTPPAGDNMCGWGTESTPMTINDCAANDALFYNGSDNPIIYVLSSFGKWPDAEINNLLAYQTVEERYAYFILHNRGPLALQCDKGLENNQQDCKVALFGNRQFQIDYLLCPNLANKYLIMASNDWTLYLNRTFVQCATRKWLKNQCQSQPNVFITTPEDLAASGNSSKEMCLFMNIDGLNLYPQQSKARYKVFYLY